METLKKLYQQLEKMQTDEERIDQLVLIANRFMYIDLGRFGVALNEVKVLAERTHNAIGMYHYHYGIGRLLTKQMDYQGALQSFTTARKIAEELGNQKFIATNLYCFAIININLGNYSEALVQATQSADIFKMMKGEGVNLSIAYCYMAMSHENLRNFEEAEKAYQQCLTVVPANEDLGTRAGDIINYAVFKVTTKDYVKALDLYFQALDLLEKSNNKLVTSQLLVNIGEVYLLMEDYNNSLTYCVNALKMLKPLDSKKALLQVYICLSKVYIAMGGLKEAAEKMKLAVELSQHITMPAALCRVAGTMGLLLFKQGKLDEAVEWLVKAVDIADATNFVDLKAEYANLLADVQLAIQQKH